MDLGNWLGAVVRSELLRYALPTFAALCAAAWAYRVNIRNKRFDVILSCNARYDTLYQDRLKIRSNAHEDSAEVAQYFRRYWGLKSDQLDYWLAGGVDPQTFANWFHSTLVAFRGDSRVGLLSYRASWHEERGNQEAVNASFVDFVDAISAIGRDEMRDSQQQYAALLFQMHRVETKEKVFNRYMFDAVPIPVRGRLTVRRLVRTLPETIQDLYWPLDLNALKERGPFLRPFYWSLKLRWRLMRLVGRLMVRWRIVAAS
ncbi:MAG: hypothetical protein ACK4RV_02460 [Caulobacter sp.]|jgi:hypothetical protein